MRRRSTVVLALASLAVLLFVVACSKLTAPPSPEPIASDTTTAAAVSARPAATPTQTATAPAPAPTQDEAEAKLGIDDVKVGTGDPVKDGDTVTVHYIGTFPDGSKFDASRDHPAMGDQPAGAPFKVTIGQGNVIKGWDQGIPGMKVGGKRKLTVPYQLAYGERGRPGIPPKATLLFEIDLLKIEKK